MTRKFVYLGLLIVVLLLAVALSGCGGGQERQETEGEMQQGQTEGGQQQMGEQPPPTTVQVMEPDTVMMRAGCQNCHKETITTTMTSDSLRAYLTSDAHPGKASSEKLTRDELDVVVLYFTQRDTTPGTQGQ
ncbi:MAG: hypothetical protein C4524_06130 [Candidatus Zixiibacteriota bacterium]|nr:MAG: hypothetical protein C4524_06130 [candidate division Zixibacteria bacterium]